MKFITFKELKEQTNVDLGRHYWDMSQLNYTAQCEADKEALRKKLNLQNKQKIYFGTQGIIITRGYTLKEINLYAQNK